jgi:hypothetical protein
VLLERCCETAFIKSPSDQTWLPKWTMAGYCKDSVICLSHEGIVPLSLSQIFITSCIQFKHLSMCPIAGAQFYSLWNLLTNFTMLQWYEIFTRL